MVDFDRMTREFILGEAKAAPSMKSYIQSLQEILHSLNPKTKTEIRRIEIAKSHLYEVRKMTRRLEEHVRILEERVYLLEEKAIPTLEKE